MKTSFGMTRDFASDEGTNVSEPLGSAHMRFSARASGVVEANSAQNITKNMTTWVMALVPGDADEVTPETASI